MATHSHMIQYVKKCATYKIEETVFVEQFWGKHCDVNCGLHFIVVASLKMLTLMHP